MIIDILSVAIIVESIYFKPDYKLETNEHDNVSIIDWEGLKDFQNSEAYYFIFVGRPTCPDCVQFKESLKDMSIKKIFQYGITIFRQIGN